MPGLLFLFLMLGLNGLAQPAIQWDTTIGGSGNDPLSKVLQTSDGGYILAGYSSSPVDGDKTAIGKGGNDYWIVKISANGTKQWDKTFGSANTDILTDIDQTTDGGYIIGGYSSSNTGGDKTENSRGDFDYWVVKLDANGIKQWDKTAGGSNYDILEAVRQTPDGGYILAGHTRSDASGDKTQDRTHPEDENATDFWLVKISVNGAIEWDKEVGTTGYGALTCFETTADGGYIFGADEGAFEQVFGQFYIKKLSSTGESQWEGRYGDTEAYSKIQAIQQTSDGGYILGGFSNSDAFVVKTNAAGTKQWAQILGRLDNSENKFFKNISSVRQTSDGGYIVGGYSSGDDSANESEVSRGGQDFWIFKLRAEGDFVWDKTIGGSNDDYLKSIIQTTEGGFLLGGYSRSPISGEKTENSQDDQGEYDFWVVKLAPEVPVPGDITSFLAKNEGGTVVLDWLCSPGSVVDRFEIEQTADRLSWHFVATVKAYETTTSYHHEKTDPLIGIEVRYRLKVIGFDGKVTYSNTRSVSVAADTPKVQWTKIIGGNRSDYLNYMLPTSDGGYIMGGRSLSGAGGDKTEPGRGGEDYWIVKISADGTKQWDKTLGGPDDDRLTSIIQTSDGGYLIGGSSQSQSGGDKTEDSKSVDLVGYLFEDFWVVKISADGTKQWDRTIGGDKYDALGAVRQTSDGNYTLQGISNSNAGGDKSQNPISGANSYDFWVVRLDQNGVKISDKSVIAIDEGPYSLGATKDGGYIVVNHKPEGHLLTKLSKNDVIEWTKIVVNVEASFTSLQQTSDNGFILGGYSASNAFGEKTQNSRGRNDYWVVKLSANGSLEWEKTIGSGDHDMLHSVKETPDGGYILAGESYSQLEWDKTESNRGSADYWLVKLTKNGTKMWDKTLGGHSIDQLFFVYPTSDGGYMLGGNTQSPVGGDRTQPLVGNVDFWLIKLDPEKPPLPVTLISFSAKKENSTALLTWETTSETSSDHFEVQHSLNGKSWKTLANVNAKGESEQLASYQYVHVSPVTGAENLYRLKMIDTDGSFAFSKISGLTFEADVAVTVFPNPASDNLTVKLIDWKNVSSIQLLNSSSVSVYKTGSSPVSKIDLKELQSGLYFIKITKADGNSVVQKIVVVR